MTSKEEIDFRIDDEFYYSLGDNDIVRYETFLLFFPLNCLEIIYEYLEGIIGKKVEDAESALFEYGFFDYIPMGRLTRKEFEAPFYQFLLSLMKNDLETAKQFIESEAIQINKSILDYLLLKPFKYSTHPFQKNIIGLTPLTVSALLGRHYIFQLLIHKGADPCQKLTLSGLKSYPFHLSLNECLLMNATYRWFKLGKQAPLPTDYAEGLINSIILAGSKCPEIVSHEHLIDNTIRVTWYWTKLEKIIGERSLLEKLISLNPTVFSILLSV